MTIQNVSSFEQNKLNYVDFLECLVRLVPIYPFSDEDEKQFPGFDDKLKFLVGKLDDKFVGIDRQFVD